MNKIAIPKITKLIKIPNILMNQCNQCQSSFEITDKDREFYQKMDVSEPTLCSECRMQRRMTWRNERSLFKRKCDLSGRPIISIYDKDVPFPVFGVDEWWSDGWDPFKYGRDFDFNRPFFQQFYELQQSVPHMGFIQSKIENSEYTNCVSNLKDCYLLFSSDYNRDCIYGTTVTNSKDSIDNLMIDLCELTYEAVFSQKIHSSKFIYFSSECSDSAFLLDCRNCMNCFMCWELRNKKYHIANKPYSKEEYFEKIKEYPMSSYSNLKQAKQHFAKIIGKAIYPPMRKRGTVIDSTGDFLTDTMNCEECYMLKNARDCKFILGVFDLKNAYDCTYAAGELGYENCECVPMPFNSIGNVNSYEGNDVFYSDSCMNNCSNVFGCMSLKHAEYCILNKQYSKEEYNELVPKIVEHMKSTGEWGEFFPTKFSPFPYNDTEAYENFNLTKEEVIKRGWRWRDKNESEYQPQTYKIPDDINEVKDSIVNEMLSCEETGKNYRIINSELEFYRKLNLPIPRMCPEVRHLKRLKWRKPYKIYDRICPKTGEKFKTTFSPDRPEVVYSEEAYLESLI